MLTSTLGVASSWKRPIPAVVRLSLTFALAGLVLYAYNFKPGRDTASAVLLAMLLLKPIELNTLRDARSLTGFGLFALFSAFLLDQGPLTLALAVPAAALAFAGCARLADAEVGTISAGTKLEAHWRDCRPVRTRDLLALAGFWLFSATQEVPCGACRT